ncbi:M48 family metallopeptidase [Larkinella arboricola]|uniref:Peptidase M48-like protein n=1 Tax=Larkinella arboricola TaxID=643671 RepID=A0A327WSE5_LARAB|nr:M48 family metallopeptidase [Larkinella arboricola]RAJ95548.1 peptidase M48-like protein [Larkinella arboricola]
MRSRVTQLVIGLVMALVALFTYFTNTQENPVTGEKQHVSMTPEQEVRLGIESAPQMAQQFGGLYPDEKVQQAVKRVGQKIVNSTSVKNSPYQFDFHVLADNRTVNAFAVPGGQIFITAALLDKLKNEDQLAGVLGHEITHVVGRHSAEQMAKQQLTQGLAGAAAIATADPDAPGRNAAIAAYVANLIGLKYGRDDEIESDQLGVRWMIESGYKPEAMIEVMEILKAAGGPNRPSEFMSSHPDPENRVARIQEAIAKYKGSN